MSYYRCTDCGATGRYGVNHTVECSLGDLAVKIERGPRVCVASPTGAHADPTGHGFCRFCSEDLPR